MADRRQRSDKERKLREETVAAVAGDDPEAAAEAKKAFKQVLKVHNAGPGGERGRPAWMDAHLPTFAP